MKSLLFLIFVLIPVTGLAIEIDQFTLPQKPLVDLGPLLTEKIVFELQKIITDSTVSRTTYLSPDYPAQRLHKAIGIGKPISTIEFWIMRDPVIPKGAKFRVPYGRSVFDGIVLPVPFVLLVEASTLNLFGFQIGSDKIGHIFQEGYEYKQIHKKYLDLKSDTRTAFAKSVEMGVSQEHGIYGTALTGIYSNGDLAANYAGLKFYLNLTEEIQVAGLIIPPILKMDKGLWVFNSNDTSHILVPFFSDHLNEAFNPSRYKFQRSLIRRAVQKRCDQWFKQDPNMTFEGEFRRIEELSTWYGEPYGWSMDFSKMVSVATECFKKK